MKKFAVSLFAIAAAVSPAAIAETEVAVDIVYDSALLADADGAKSVIASIEAQAADACTYRAAFTYIKTVDQTCVDAVVAEAVTAIVAERQAEGLETAEEFASLTAIEVASL